MKRHILNLLICLLLVLSLCPAAMAAALDTTDLAIAGNTVTIGQSQNAVLEALDAAGKTAKLAVPYAQADVYVLKDNNTVVSHNWITKDSETFLQFEVPGAGVYVITAGTPKSLDEQLDSNIRSIIVQPGDKLNKDHAVADGTVIHANGSIAAGGNSAHTLTATGSLTIYDLNGLVSVTLAAGDQISFDTDGKATVKPAMISNYGYGKVTVTFRNQQGSLITQTHFLAEGEAMVISANDKITGSSLFPAGDKDSNGKPDYAVTYDHYTYTHVRNSTGKIIAYGGGLYEKCTAITLTLEGSSSPITLAVRSNGADLVSVSGVSVSRESNGNTCLVLNGSYLNTLPVGTHTLTFQYNDGAASTGKLRIVEAAPLADESNPKTGDPILLCAAAMLLSGMTMAGMLSVYDKKRYP